MTSKYDFMKDIADRTLRESALHPDDEQFAKDAEKMAAKINKMAPIPEPPIEDRKCALCYGKEGLGQGRFLEVVLVNQDGNCIFTGKWRWQYVCDQHQDRIDYQGAV